MIKTEKIYVLGCGSIGLTLAAYLTAAGKNVVAVRTSKSDIPASQIFTDAADQLRMHVTHSSERTAAVEMLPHSYRQEFIQNILRRGNRFLKQFRQRVAQSLSLHKNIQQIHEHQHQPRHGVRV